MSAENSSLVLLGVSHRSAPISVRERVAYTPTGVVRALDAIGDSAAVDEAVLLHTCNRTEYYMVVREAQPNNLRELVLAHLTEFHGLDEVAIRELDAALYETRGGAVAGHLFRVASGLDSLVLGEYQILGQVRAAAQAADHAGAIGAVLQRLFETAVRVGRRARSETDIGRRAASVPSVAVDLARSAIPGVADPSVVVIGAGKMGTAAAKNMLAGGARNVIVSNRSYERAAELARDWGGEAVRLDALPQVLVDADVVVASTGSPSPLLGADLVAAAMRERPARPLVIVDIAVPRDVDPAVAEIPGVILYDIDDLEATVELNLAERLESAPGVEAIVEQELDRFTRWHTTLEVEPTIAELHRWAEGIRATELDRALRRLDALEEEQREIVRAMSVALVGKLLHPPVRTLKTRAVSGQSATYAEAVRDLFALRSRGNGDTPPTPEPRSTGNGDTPPVPEDDTVSRSSS